MAEPPPAAQGRPFVKTVLGWRHPARGAETALSAERKNGSSRVPKEGARGGTTGSPALRK